MNFGWALTPNPANVIPKDGSTIWVFIDNQPFGHPVYNQNRSDISTLFPGLQNSNGAIGYYLIDTTKLTNGLHTISWTATDSAGNVQGLGSRFFDVENSIRAHRLRRLRRQLMKAIPKSRINPLKQRSTL